MNTSSTYFSPISSSPSSYPIYHFPRTELIPGFSDVYFSIVAPFVAYWIVSFLFLLIDISGLSIFERHRIHAPEETKSKNKVTMKQVIWAVLFQQVIQTALGLAWLREDDPAFGPFRDHGDSIDKYSKVTASLAVALLGKTLGSEAVKRYGTSLGTWLYWWGIPTVQFLFAAFVLDAWQYFWHRYFHTNVFLYRHVHSWHHRLYAPYSFGALYNHPLEGFVLDTCGAVVAHTLSLMTTRQGILFFAISTAKTVDDHCGFAFPWDPMQHLFGNNADYHDIHHQIGGLKANFSQPYFIHFDYFLGTRMTRPEFEARKIHRSLKPKTSSPPSEVEGLNDLAPIATSKRDQIATKED